jgi:putative transposase
MRKSRFSEEQIIAILREQEVGARTEEVCRRHGISTTTFYKWKARYGGLEVSEARRLKTLEDENRRLKKLLAEAVLDVAALKDLLAKTELACSAASGGTPAHGGARSLPASRLQAARGRPQDGAPARARGRRSGPGASAEPGR